MSGIKKVSRHDLYNSESEESEVESAPILPNIEFDIIENQDEDADADVQMGEQEEDFEFPLFSFGGGATTTTKQEPKDAQDEELKDQDEERGRSQVKSNIMRVTLRSPSPEIINQERPQSYYFANYTEQDQENFAKSAISGDDVWANAQALQNIIPCGPVGRVINLAEYNEKVERELTQLKKKIRPGKKKRLASIKGKQTNKEKAKIQKAIDAKAKAKLMKKIHHKRGGKKNKKKAAATTANAKTNTSAKPKYRTE